MTDVDIRTGIATRVVTGRWLRPDGVTPQTGRVLFTPSTRLVRPGGEFVLPRPIAVDLDATGSLSVALPCTDDPTIRPDGWAWILTERFPGNAAVWSFQLPSGGIPLDLTTVAPAPCPDPCPPGGSAADLPPVIPWAPTPADIPPGPWPDSTAWITGAKPGPYQLHVETATPPPIFDPATGRYAVAAAPGVYVELGDTGIRELKTLVVTPPGAGASVNTSRWQRRGGSVNTSLQVAKVDLSLWKSVDWGGNKVPDPLSDVYGFASSGSEQIFINVGGRANVGPPDHFVNPIRNPWPAAATAGKLWSLTIGPRQAIAGEPWPVTLPGTPITPPLGWVAPRVARRGGMDRGPDWDAQVADLIADGRLPVDYHDNNPWTNPEWWAEH